MADAADDNSSTFPVYNKDTGKVERYPKQQSFATRMVENATVSPAMSQTLHRERSAKGWKTKDPAGTD